MSKLKDYKFHELCLQFPLLPENELEDLAEDIKKNGLFNPISMYKGEVLDGRNRLLACFKAGIEPTHRIISSEIDAIAVVISENIKRRHLNPAQRVDIGLQLFEKRKQKQQQETKKEEIPKIQDPNMEKLLELNENKKIAKSIGSKPEIVKKVRVILEKAEEDPKIKKLFEKAKEGKGNIDTVYKKTLPEKPKKKLIKKPKEIENIELRQKLEDTKEEIKEIKEDKYLYKNLYEEIKQIAKDLGYWDEIVSKLSVVAEKKPNVFPTPKQLREALN